MTAKFPFNDLFERYMDGTASAEDIRLLVSYFDIEDNEPLLRSLIAAELAREHNDKIENRHVDSVLDDVRLSVLQKIERRSVDHAVVLPKFPWIRLITAAIVLFVFSVCLLFFWPDLKERFNPVKMDAMTTGAGQRKIVTLTDGTKIWLAPSSSLSFPEEFRGPFRKVSLKGEAFFEVAKDKSHPFIIKTGNMETRVVGTSFDIRSFDIERYRKVTLVTGIVRVSVQGKSGLGGTIVILKPNQKSTLDKNNGNLVGSDCPAAVSMLKRKDGILAFDSVPAQEIVNDLNRYYNKSISIESKCGRRLVNGEFDTNKPIITVLKQLSVALDVSVTSEKGNYLLRGGCGQ